MKESYYTILMRKCIAGVCTEEEDDSLTDWLKQDEQRLIFFARLIIQITTGDDQVLEDIPKVSNDDELTPEELEELLRDFWDRVIRRNIE